MALGKKVNYNLVSIISPLKLSKGTFISNSIFFPNYSDFNESSLSIVLEIGEVSSFSGSISVTIENSVDGVEFKPVWEGKKIFKDIESKSCGNQSQKVAVGGDDFDGVYIRIKVITIGNISAAIASYCVRQEK